MFYGMKGSETKAVDKDASEKDGGGYAIGRKVRRRAIHAGDSNTSRKIVSVGDD